MEIETQRGNGVFWTGNHWGRLRRWVTSAIMTLLLSLTVSTSAQAAPIRGAFEFWGYQSVGHNNVWCQGTDAGVVMRCAVQNLAGSGSIVNNCVETSRYIAPGSLGIGGNRYGGAVFGTCNIHSISPPQDWVFQLSARSSLSVTLVNILVCPTGTTWTGDARHECSCNAGYRLDAAGTSCVPIAPVQCPANSSGTPPACVCNADFKFDAAGTSCVPVVTCPIPKFPDLNESDACTRSLEKGAGKDVDNACEPLDPEMVKQEKCLAKKIRDLGISYTEPSATVRTVAYQQHFVDLWKWHKRIEQEQGAWSDAEKQECAPMVAIVEAEWKRHVLIGTPSNGGPDAPHVLRKAIDINKSIPKAMGAVVNKTTFLVPFPTYCLLCLPEYPVYIGDVQDYVNSPLVNPPACKLRWGGRFKGKDFDPVHFDLFLK